MVATIQIMGRVMSDVERRTGKTGNTFVSFSLGNIRRNPIPEQGIYLDFYRCTIFGARGDAFAKYMHKESPVYIVGTLENDHYTTKDEEKKSVPNIIVSDWSFMIKETQAGTEAAVEKKLTQDASLNDDLPF